MTRFPFVIEKRLYLIAVFAAFLSARARVAIALRQSISRSRHCPVSQHGVNSLWQSTKALWTATTPAGFRSDGNRHCKPPKAVWQSTNAKCTSPSLRNAPLRHCEPKAWQSTPAKRGCSHTLYPTPYTLILAFLLTLAPLAHSASDTWSGSADTTWYTSNKSAANFTISTAEQLAGLANLVNGTSGNGTYNMSGKTITLGANIELNDTTENSGWQNWGTSNSNLKQWTPIGTSTNGRKFKGTFDGAGFAIRGLYISTSNNYQGLFGYDSAAVIKNVGVIAGYVKGGQYTGFLVGYNYSGTISNSYATGNVSGTGSYVSGLAGYNGGTISNSYATGSVSGSSSYVGGLAGYSHGTISNSYYDMETSGQSGGYGTPKTTAQMQSQEMVDTLNFVAGIERNNAWTHNSGKYPTLSNGIAPELDIASYFASGNGTSGNPYIITTKAHLENLAILTNAGHSFQSEYISLGNNIALNDTANWNSWNSETNNLNQWTPIGTSGKNFKGTFDGAGHTIRGLYISTSSSYQGLFGYDSAAVIKNVGVIAGYVEGYNYVGFLAGYNESGTISNSYATGNVSGSGSYSSVGGLAGYNESGTISNSYATGNVSGSSNVGGLAGRNEGTISNSYATGNVSSTGSHVGGLAGYNGGTISNSYATGNVSGGGYVGGLAGENNSSTIRNSYSAGNVSGSNIVGGLVGVNPSGTISNSYSAGNVSGSGSSYAGGLVGMNPSGTISNSYYDTQTSEQNDVGKGTPKSTAQMKQRATFVDWDFTDIWGIDADINSGMPHFMWEYVIRNDIEIQDQTYASTKICPEPSVNFEGVALAANVDFTYSCEDFENINAGKGYVTVIGKGTFIEKCYAKGKKTAEFNITKSDTLFKDSSINIAYAPDLTLAGIALSANYAWNAPTTAVTGVGDNQIFPATYTSPNTNYNPAIGNIVVNVAKGDGIASVIIANWTYSETANAPSASSATNPTLLTIKYAGTTNASAVYDTSAAPPTEAGTYSVIATFEETSNYKELKTATPFTINRAVGTCSVTMENFISSGTKSQPVPVSATNGTSSVTYTYKSTDGTSYAEQSSIPSNEGTYIVTATFAQVANYNACIADYEFVITADETTPLNVTWTGGVSFVYNKMVQGPKPKIDGRNDIELTVVNLQSEAGIYVGSTAARALLPSVYMQLYHLKNETKGYEILQAPLDVIFEDKNIAAIDSIIPSKNSTDPDTLYVDAALVADSAALRDTLTRMLGYSGFKTDTTNNESDDAGVLSGTPYISFPSWDYPWETAPSQQILAKRVSTSVKATAVVSTKSVTAKNYEVNGKEIVILAREEEEAMGYCKVANSGCAYVSTFICAAFKGEAVNTCDGTPLANTPIPYTQNPIPTYFNLQGQPLGSVKPKTAGVYIEKSALGVRKVLSTP